MKKFTLIALMHLSFFAHAQNRINDHNSIGWYALFLTPKFSDKFSGHLDYQWRRTDVITNWQQSLLRVGLTYKANSQLSFQLGYAWAKTFVYGDYSIIAVPKPFPEHRIYEQLQVTTPVGKTMLTHRLRLEQRWLGRFKSIQSPKADDWIFLNRFRYMPRLDVPLDKKLYAAMYDEIFIGFGRQVGENVFDQNRLAILLGYKFSKTVRLEGGFLSQIVQLPREIETKNVFQYNNGIVVNTYLSF